MQPKSLINFSCSICTAKQQLYELHFQVFNVTEYCGGTRATQHKRRVENKEQAAATEAAGQLSVRCGDAGVLAAERRES